MNFFIHIKESNYNVLISLPVNFNENFECYQSDRARLLGLNHKMLK
jgi:hypothetical protein